MDVKVYYTRNTEREVHQPDGFSVAVCWNINAESKEREGQPYIDLVQFFDSEPDKDGFCYEDEDSPVVGGITAEEAEEVADELLWAADYLRQQT